MCEGRRIQGDGRNVNGRRNANVKDFARKEGACRVYVEVWKCANMAILNVKCIWRVVARVKCCQGVTTSRKAS